jgi:hypothetical protein
MATLTKLESKLAEVLGLAMAAQDSAQQVRGMLGREQEAAEMREAYLGGEDDPLDGFEFLTMAEAGEVGHWSIVAKLNEQARIGEVRKLTQWALPIQQRHLEEALDGSLKLAADEDPFEEEQSTR